MAEVTNVWKRIYQEEVDKIQAVCRGTSPWAPIWSKGTTYMLQSDFSYLLVSIEKLKGVQWIPGDGQPPADQWLELLKRIRDAGKFCQVFVSPQGAKTIVKELDGTGFVLAINDERLTPEEARDLYKDLTS